MTIDLIFICEIIGTIVFAISGALVAIERRLDVFGVIVLAVCTAVGGGMTRDIIIGNTPPTMFLNPIYCIVAVLTAISLFVFYPLFHRSKIANKLDKMRMIVTIADAVGLGIFTVVGINVSVAFGADTAFLAIFVGVITGVGGGLLRDIMANRTPVILKKDVYASASIAGGIIYYYIRYLLSPNLSIIAGVSVILAIRLLVIWKNMQLPSSKDLIKQEL